MVVTSGENRPSAVLQSGLDVSVNFVREGPFPGKIEARYVRRKPEVFIVYLSSQTGCAKACRMCHLTQSGQTDFEDVPIDGYFQQADEVLEWYDRLNQPARIAHFNFMARGEVFANQYVHADAERLLIGLGQRATSRGLVPVFKFSTIMPQEMAEVALADLFGAFSPDIYYSIYSVDPRFRRRWLPKAMDAELALAKLYDYQRIARKVPVLHWAFIEGENSDEASVAHLCDAVNAAGLRVDVNIVRYNPYSERQGVEPSIEVIEAHRRLLMDRLQGSRVQIVDRVGFDVKASCGMFVGDRGA
jgi:adenine C2-methylase RlmN of 23S rRNA A2503 and tRNA A37